MTDPQPKETKTTEPPEGYGEERASKIQGWVVLHEEPEETFAVGPFPSAEQAEDVLFPCGHPSRIVRILLVEEWVVDLSTRVLLARLGELRRAKLTEQRTVHD